MLNMTKKFKDAIKSRRTFYQIDNKSTLSEKELLDLIRFAAISDIDRNIDSYKYGRKTTAACGSDLE